MLFFPHTKSLLCLMDMKLHQLSKYYIDFITKTLFAAFVNRKFAPRCSVCCQPIMPEPGQEETVRIVALDRSFHVNCYVCEVRMV